MLHQHHYRKPAHLVIEHFLSFSLSVAYGAASTTTKPSSFGEQYLWKLGVKKDSCSKVTIGKDSIVVACLPVYEVPMFIKCRYFENSFESNIVMIFS